MKTIVQSQTLGSLDLYFLFLFYLECNVSSFGGNKIEIETKPKLLIALCILNAHPEIS